MKTALYILDENRMPVAAKNVAEWREWYDKHTHMVAETRLTMHFVSTVFLGIDHNPFPTGAPVLWETRVSGGTLHDLQARYTSEADAVIGHAAMVDSAKEAEKS